MNYAVITKAEADYVGDPEDTDKILWGGAMSAVDELRPTNDWRADYRALLYNRSPRNGAKLRARDLEVTGMSYALTLPKCVSILELLGIDDRVAGCVERAAKVCMNFAELIVAPAGHISDGTKAHPVILLGAFQRLVKSDPPMPHRHLHLNALSLAYDDQRQRTTAADLTVFSHSGELLKMLFQHEIAWELTRVGYGIDPEKGSFKIKGFPQKIVDQFNAGPRPRRKKGFARLPEGYFRQQQERWQKELGPDLMAQLRDLGRGTVAAPAPFSYTEVMARTARWSMMGEFFVPTDVIATRTLRHTLGRPPVEIHKLARWMTGAGIDGANARGFALDGRWCWGTSQNLMTEQELLSLISKLPLAGHGWLPENTGNTWWERQLIMDRHPVAVLKADLDWHTKQALAQKLGASVIFRDDLRGAPAALLAGEWMESLRAGKRLLVVDDVKQKSEHPWVDCLPRSGVPVLREHERSTVEIGKPHGLHAEFVEGSAVEVFAASYSHRPSSYLLVGHTELEASLKKVRGLRAARAKRPRMEIKRLCLIPVGSDPQPGLAAQFARNTGGIYATETLKILRVDPNSLLVERPTGLRALVPRAQWPAPTYYKAAQEALTPGDRIRLTRNNGPHPQRTGLRGGSEFVVWSVEKDGTARLNGGRILPPDAGHWDYAFCRVVEDGPPTRHCVAVCAVDDLPLLAAFGWLQRRVKVVLCGASKEQAEKALRATMGKHGDSCLPGTDHIGYALGMQLSPAKPVDKSVRPVVAGVPRPDDSMELDKENGIEPASPSAGRGLDI